MHASLSPSRPAALATALLLALAAPAALAAGVDPAVVKLIEARDEMVLATAQKYLTVGDNQTLAAAEQADRQVLAAARKYAEAATDHADAGDAATLASAHAHADAGDAQTLQAAGQYATQADAQVLAAAKKYASGAQDHADRGDVATLRSANAYTDQRVAAAVQPQLDALRDDVWSRMASTDRRVNRISAMGSAMTQMAVNAANGSGERGRLAVGVGYTDGEEAVSVGYGLRVGRGSFSLGAAFGGGENSVGVGFGVDL